jgi:hypothetical protein
MIRSRESLVGAWAFLIGIILALIIGIIGKINPIVLGILAVLGVIVGYFVTEKDSHTFLLAAVSLVIVSFAGIQGLVLSAAILGVDIGEIISTILGALLVLFVPATVVVALKMVFSISKS